MKCEDFKKYMADLCDKQTDPAITEACRQHMRMCRMPCLLRRLHAHGKLTYTQIRPLVRENPTGRQHLSSSDDG